MARIADFKGTKPVEERHKLDEAALDAWMASKSKTIAGPLTINQFKGGQSNPTYQLVTPTRKYVLRKKPGGKLLPSAHAVDREFRVMSALYPTGFPVARQYALCQRRQRARRHVLRHGNGRRPHPMERRACPNSTPRNGARSTKTRSRRSRKLHNTDYDDIGLADYGKPGNYFARQIDRWSKQYKLSETETIDEMNRLIEWLPQTIPPGERTSIVHGDYRLDNHGPARNRTARDRGAGLGALDARRSARRLHLLSDELGDAE